MEKQKLLITPAPDRTEMLSPPARSRGQVTWRSVAERIKARTLNTNTLHSARPKAERTYDAIDRLESGSVETKPEKI